MTLGSLERQWMPGHRRTVQSQTSCSTPVQRLEAEYARIMRVSAEELDLKPAVYLREGSDLMAQLRDQLIMLPEIEVLTPECNIDEANVGVPTPEMEAKMRGILRRRRSIFLGDGNAAPAPARGVVCDIDIGEAKPLSRYPLPLIDDLLVDFKSAMRFMSLDIASGFWAVRMTERAKLISAFVCPFGHFQWPRVPFGLKIAPLIYQSIINNCLWGFVRLPPEEEALVGQEVLVFLNLEPQEVA
ncbi:reverse transcriptase [Phytophthora megakarya]|uniref:Reverse transcriptase n=1 Tax=Phytophthora megakarya TaxID=4795 RepID=A0A225VBN4_9STRA|nr:reverse transcriptase [Phytophthora megakarya]